MLTACGYVKNILMNRAVSLIKIETYEENALKDALTRCLEPLGGISAYIKTSGTTILKPNLLRSANKDLAVTTHPNIVKIIGEMIRAGGGSPLLADSPGGGYAYTKEKLEEVYRTTGMDTTGVPLSFDTTYSIRHNPGGRLMKRFEVVTPIIEASSIINIAKFKTHTLTTLSLAVKNMFGAVPGRIKIGYHGRFQNDDDFAQMLLDLAQLIRPDLSIIDAVVGMEGNGPNYGTPVKMGFIAASADPLALDLVMADLAGARPEQVPHLRLAINNGLVPPSIGELKIFSNAPPDSFRRNILLPVTKTTRRGGLLVRTLTAILRPWFKRLLTVRPTVDPKVCTACAVCVRACPTGAAQMTDHVSKKSARITDKLCIRCYCCHEQCPYNAIDLKRPLLYRIGGFANEKK